MIGPLAYIGGKRRLAPLLIRLLPPHTTYVEPFAGGCQVFFRKPPSKVEVLNDLDNEVYNFLRVVQNHPNELTRALTYAIAGRKLHGIFLRQNPDDLTEIQRAARFLWLQKNSFAGRVSRQNYHVCVSKPSNYNPITLPARIEEAAKRLQRVQLECSSYESVLSRYDRTTTVFYIDPPYVGLKLYRFNFANDQFLELADRLQRLKGKFILSINDCPTARTVFTMFNLWSTAVPYTATRAVRTVRELIITNYDPPHLDERTLRRETNFSEGGSQTKEPLCPPALIPTTSP